MPLRRAPTHVGHRLQSAGRHPLVHLVLELGLAAAAIVGASALVRAAGPAWGTDTRPGQAPGFATSIVMAAFVLVALVVGVRAVERRPVAETGLVRHDAVRDLGVGLVAGGAAMGAVIGMLALAGWYRVITVAPAAAVPGLLAREAGLLLAAAVVEEVVFRAILFRLIERAAGTGIALGASALLFGLAHLGTPHATPAGALAIALEAGVALAALYALTRSLWPVVGVHWGWNLAEGPVFGAQISGNVTGDGGIASVLHPVLPGPALWTGGAFGPEAGLATVLLWTVIGIVLLAMAARRGRLVAAPWTFGRRRPAV